MQTHRWVDFYAKSIALLGLSGLAATGALIDHWPALGNFPDVQLAEHWLGSPDVQTITEFPTLPPSPIAIRPFKARPVALPPSIVSPRFAVSFRPRHVDEVVVTRTLPVPATIGLPDLPVFELAALPEPEDVELVDTWQPMPAPAMTLASSEEGFFSGALRKTSASLDKARTSLVDAARAVSGKVKRLF